MTLQDFLKAKGYEKIEHTFEWGGQIAHSVDLGIGCVGIPVFVLEKNGNFRLSTPEEAIEIFHKECEIFYPDED